MKRLIMLPFLLAVAGLSACSMHIPQNAQEFRVGAAESGFAEIETIEVKRPYSTVVSTFKKYTNKCLSMAYQVSSCVNGACSSSVQTYTPTLITTKTATEMHVQLDVSNAHYLGDSEPPKNGMYILVLDAAPQGKKATRIQLYSGKWGYSGIKKAVLGWADGTVKGCPDLSQT